MSKGPSMQFKTVAGFERAVKVCEKHLSQKKWTKDSINGMLHFSSIKAEEKFMIVWSNLK
tara:strand:- start:1237 stop:1416 length:180 start_codon:yes stop_codon:yes gene_type:complete